MSEQHISGKHTLVGKVVADRYEVLSLIGHGAMGNVYKSKHTVIGRIFAVKTLMVQHDPEDRALKRFQQEAQSMSILTHPNLIQISDYGQTEDGVPFFIMEYLEGVSLADWIKRHGPMPVETALPLFAQIADALAHAHSKGLVHRDLKPSNIMLTGDDQNFVKVVDLGIAKATQTEEDMRLTQTGEVFGSPLYMSPEQCMGNQVDARSDVYSLGCLMFETLSGVPPLKGENFIQTAYKHMHEAPACLNQLKPEICGDIATIVNTCLEKDPDDRIANMTLLRDLLREFGAPTCDSQGNTLSASERNAIIDAKFGDKLGAKTTMKLKKPVGDQRRVSTPLMAAAVALPLLMAGAWFLFGHGGMSHNGTTDGATKSTVLTKSSVIAGTGTNATQKTIDTNTSSTLSVESPLFEKFNPSAKEEIDVIAVYTAQPKSERIGAEAENVQEDVTVKVHPKEKPITLVLFSYMPVHWNVKPYAGAVIKKVIASGFHPPKVVVPTSNKSLVTAFSTQKGQHGFDTRGFKANSTPEESLINREDIYKQIQDGVHQLLGPDVQIRQFQGKYYGTAFDLNNPEVDK